MNEDFKNFQALIMTNSVDPDEIADYEPSHLAVHYLQRSTGL